MAPLADRLQIWGFYKGAMIYSDGSMGFGLELIPVDVSSHDEQQLVGLSSQLKNFVDILPEGLSFQFVQDILPDEVSEKNTNDANEFVMSLESERNELLLEQSQNGTLVRHTLYAIFRQTSERVSPPKRRFSSQRQFEKIIGTELEHHLTSLSQLKEDILRHFHRVSLSPKFLSEKKLCELIYRQWNPCRNKPLGEYDPEDVRESLLFSDVSVDEKGFSIGSCQHRIISLKILPEATQPAMAGLLRQLPVGSRCFLTVHIPDQQKELDSLQSQRRMTFSMVDGKEGVSDLEGQAKLDDLEALTEEVLNQGERVFNVSLNVVLRSTDPYDLEDQVSQTLATLRELNGMEAMEESIAAFDIFANLALPNAIETERIKRMKSSNLCDLLPIYGPWRGHEKASIQLKSTLDSLVGFDPFSSELPNANQVITGGSGSGKSFLTNLIILQMQKKAPQTFILDVGGSYKRTCEVLNGHYVPIELDSAISINPFDLDESGAISPGQIKFLLGLVDLVCREEGTKRLGKLQSVEIEQAVQRVYENITSPKLSDLRNELSRHADQEIRNMGKILSIWCGNTPYGKFIDRDTSISLSKNTLCFDLKGLKTHEDLQSVMLYLLTHYIWRAVQKNRSQQKLVVFDECWQLLENDAGSAFVGECFRTFRKYNASAIAISQNIDDFANSRVSGAVLSNSATKWVLSQKGADQARLKSVLQLNDIEMEQIANLHQDKGKYSQVFLMAGEKHISTRIEPTELEYHLATTDPKDLAKLVI